MLNQHRLKLHRRVEAKVTYVYAYVDPRNDEPIYIGKGQGLRYADHVCDTSLSQSDAIYTRLREILADGEFPEVYFLIENITDAEGCFWEAFYIDAIGQENAAYNAGTLLNVRAGGISNISVKYKGVAKYRKKFKGGVCIDKKRLHIGYYKTAEECARAVDEATVERDGINTKWYQLNFMEEWDGTKCLRPLVRRKVNHEPVAQTSKYLGVRYGRNNGKKGAGWFATVEFRQRRRTRGPYSTEERAALKRDEMALQFQGSRARLNFPFQR